MTTLRTDDTVKSIRETLALAQSAIHFRAAAGHDVDRAQRDAELLGRLIADCDRQRPLGPDGKHGDGERCTSTCGCDRVQAGPPTGFANWWTDCGPEALLQEALTRADDVGLPGTVAHLIKKELLNGLWWLGKVRPMQSDVEWVEEHVPRATFETGWGNLARDVLALPVRGTTRHVHTDAECGHRLVPLEVEGARTCHHCGDHYAASEWCPQRCEVTYHEIIASVSEAGG